jgi:putative thioredoxin
MGYSIEVDSTNFDSEVIEKSYLNTVILDFYAVWCGPCKLVKPMLEKLASEYNFILAKIDIDKNPELAEQYDVEGVPDVRIVSKGEVLPCFVGALPEEQIRDLFSRLDLESELEAGLAEIKEAIALDDFTTVKQLFDYLFPKYPNEPQLVIMAVKFLVRLEKWSDAYRLISAIKEENHVVKGWKTLLEFQQLIQENNPLDSIFFVGITAALKEDYAQALDKLVTVVGESRKYRQDRARKAMIAIFNILGINHILTQEYQEKLTFLLY